MVNLAEFKKFFLFNLIGSLIISALVGVVTVLIGEFNEVTTKVLLTLLMVILHSLFCLGFIWKGKKTSEDLTFFSNVLFFIIVFSFLSSIFGIWKIITGSIVVNLYQTYFVVGLSALHGNVLSLALKKEDYLDKVIYANYIIIVIVAIMLLPVIYIEDAYIKLGDFYFRVLGAIGIIDGTLSVLTMIFYKLHLHKTESNVQPTLQPIVNPTATTQTSGTKSELKKK